MNNRGNYLHEDIDELLQINPRKGTSLEWGVFSSKSPSPEQKELVQGSLRDIFNDFTEIISGELKYLDKSK